jgi:hypothetical protein
MSKDNPIEQRCRYKTKRLLVKSWRYLRYTPLRGQVFTKKIIDLLTPEVTETLPEEW